MPEDNYPKLEIDNRPYRARQGRNRLSEALKLHAKFGLTAFDWLKLQPEDVQLKEIHKRCFGGPRGENMIEMKDLFESVKKARTLHMNAYGEIVSTLHRDRPDNAFDNYDALRPR